MAWPHKNQEVKINKCSATIGFCGGRKRWVASWPCVRTTKVLQIYPPQSCASTEYVYVYKNETKREVVVTDPRMTASQRKNFTLIIE